jgi:hypothetical protein
MSRPEHPTVANWRRPIPGEDPAIARLTAMIAALSSELAITRERLDTVERLAEQAGVFTQDQVETFEPSAQASAARDELRQRQIAKVFRPLRDEAEREARLAAEGAAR